MHQFRTVFICAVLALILGGARAQQGAPRVTVSSVQGYDGQTLPVEITTSPELIGYSGVKLTVAFPSQVALVMLSRRDDPPEIDQPDALLYQPLVAAVSSPGEVVIGLVSTRSAQTSGRLARFPLTIRPDALAGIFPLHLSADLEDNFGSLNVQTIDGQLNVLGLRPGDLDGDGQVDLGDVRIALRSLLGGPALTPNQSTAADRNGDGKVDLADIRLLLREALGL